MFILLFILKFKKTGCGF